MAGDWIKVESVTPDKPEVDMMANELDIDHDSVVGKLIRLWIWADQQSISGNGLSVTKKMIDRITFHNGFSVALEKVGWLKGVDGAFSLPNFEQHNGQTAKTRAATNRRVARSRANSNAPTVTKSEQKPLPEKRRDREEKKVRTFSKPSVEEVSEYGKTRDANFDEAEKFTDFYESKGWKVGSSPMKDWKATVRNWMRDKNYGSTPSHHTSQIMNPLEVKV